MTLIPPTWTVAAELGVLVALMSGSGYVGWHERDVRGQRDTAVASADKANGVAIQALDLVHGTQVALAAADAYRKQAAALRPQIQVIHDKAAPVLVTLETCPLPADARGLLDSAAAIADTTGAPAPGAGRGADGAGPPARVILNTDSGGPLPPRP